MKAKVVGLEYVNYTKKKDGSKVSGISVHIQKDPSPDKLNNFKGKETSTVWISEASTDLFNKARILPLDCTVDFIYDFDGRYSYLSDLKVESSDVDKKSN